MAPGPATYTSLDPGGPLPAPPPAAPLPAVTEVARPRPARAGVLVHESYGASFDVGPIIGGDPFGLFGGDLNTDPLLTGRYGGFWPADRVALPTKGPAGFFSEVQLRAVVSWSRYLCQRNPLAIGFRDRVRDFVGPVAVQWVRRGQTPGAAPSGPADADGDGEPDADPLVTAVTQVVEEWCERSEWGRGAEDRQKECRERSIEDGEVNLRLGPGGADRDFLPWVRFVEPEQVRPPAGRVDLPPWIDPADVDWRWGVATSRRDAECVYGFWVCDPDAGGATGEFVPAAGTVPAGAGNPAGEVVRLKCNVKRTEKRGLPDFFPVEHHLQDALGLLLNMGGTAREQSSVAWREKHAGVPEQVRTMLAQGAEVYSRFGREGTTATLPAGGRFPVRTHNGVKVVHAERDREFEEGPTAAGAPSFVAVCDAILKAVGFRFAIPDWFSGAADGFASALVTGSPFVSFIQERQQQVEGFAAALMAVVVRLAEGSGRLPAGAARAVRPTTTTKPVVIADEEKQVRTFLALYDKNLADPMAFVKERGGDPKVVAANIAAWKKKFPEPGRPQQPGYERRVVTDKNGVQRLMRVRAAGDPTPAPPGSAGGDGSSPNDGDDLFPAREGAVLLDAALVEFVREAAGLVEKDVTVHRGGKTFTQKRLVRPDEAPHAPGVAAADPSGGTVGPGLWKKIGAILGRGAELAGRAEHHLKELVLAAHGKLPAGLRGVTAAAFRLGMIGFDIGQAAAAAAAAARGVAPDRIDRVGHLLAVADVALFKGAKAMALLHVPGGHAAFAVAGTLPVASLCYLAYSASVAPLKTARAAIAAVKGATKTTAGKAWADARSVPVDFKAAVRGLAAKAGLRGAVSEAADDAPQLGRFMAALGAADDAGADWLVALYAAALAECNGNTEAAAGLALVAAESSGGPPPAAD